MRLKTATFTVHADSRQSARWKQAAEGEAFSSVGGWLAAAADAYLKARARAGMPIPLAWHRGPFPVRFFDGQEREVRGLVSEPFAIYRGTQKAPDTTGCDRYTLIYRPAGRVLATLKSAAQCKALAAELARLWVRGDGSEPSGNPAPVIPSHPA